MSWRFIIVRNPWGGVDGDETWVITDDATGEVVLSGNIPFTYSDCDVYCGDIECLLQAVIQLQRRATLMAILIYQSRVHSVMVVRTIWRSLLKLFDVVLIGGTMAMGMKRFTYGYNVGSYTIEYADGTVLEMSYTNDWNEVYECI